MPHNLPIATQTRQRNMNAIRNIIRNHFAPYMLWDNYGTKRYCMSMTEAMDWLPACGPDAAIINRRTRVIEVSRHQTRAY